MSHEDPPRTLPVEPAVHVETFASHYTLTWTADSLSRFLAAVRSDTLPAAATAVVDATDTAGRERVPVRELEADPAVRYVRVEHPAGWTVSWERRTSPTVSASGAPPASVCRELHRRTTACDRWPSAAVNELRGIAGGPG